MGGSIKVKGIQQVIIPFDWIIGYQVNVLVPVWRANKNNIVRINSPDRLYQLNGIGFNVRPGLLFGLIEDLVNDIGILAVGGCYFSKELLCLF